MLENKSGQIRQKVLEMVRERGEGKTICPSEVARVMFVDWRAQMEAVRKMAFELADRGEVVVMQKGLAVGRDVRGPIRIGLPPTPG